MSTLSFITKTTILLVAASLSHLSVAEEKADIVLESTIIGDANAQPTTTYIVNWDGTPSADYLAWDLDQKPADDILTLIDKNELRRSADMYNGSIMESIRSR